MANTTTKAPSVEDIMSRPVVTANPTNSVATCAGLMNDAHVGSVVILDNGKVVGILTERDLVGLAATRYGSDWTRSPVKEWMHEEVDTIPPTTAIADAFRTISERGYRHLPVESDGVLVGIVTMRDLMREARILPADRYAGEVPKGLEGLAVAETEIGDVRGQQGFFHYRQYSGVELAEKRSFEDVWHLMFEGQLPTAAQAKAFREETVPLRAIPAAVKPLLAGIAKLGDEFVPLQAAKSAFSLVSSELHTRLKADLAACSGTNSSPSLAIPASSGFTAAGIARNGTVSSRNAFAWAAVGSCPSNIRCQTSSKLRFSASSTPLYWR